MKNKTLIYVVVSILIGIILGKNIYDGYAKEVKDTFLENKSKTIYLIQYGVYSSNDSMVKNTKNLKNYFYYVEENKFHVLIGITSNKELKNKIVKAYNITTDIYLKKVKIDNQTFIETLNQYDNLVETNNDDDMIITLEKQVLSKYDELVIRDGADVN